MSSMFLCQKKYPWNEKIGVQKAKLFKEYDGKAIFLHPVKFYSSILKYSASK